MAAADIIEFSKTGNLEAMRRLVQTGNLRVDFRCPPDGTTALYWGACNGHLVICDWLIRHGADVSQTTEKSGSLPLHGAADRGHVQCVRLLLRSGSDINRCTKSNGDTPLHLAAYRGHLAVCRLLLEYGACWEIKNIQGRTPLEEAQAKSHYDVFQLLCKVRQSRLERVRSSSKLRSESCELSPSKKMIENDERRERKLITSAFDLSGQNYSDFGTKLSDSGCTRSFSPGCPRLSDPSYLGTFNPCTRSSDPALETNSRPNSLSGTFCDRPKTENDLDTCYNISDVCQFPKNRFVAHAHNVTSSCINNNDVTSGSVQSEELIAKLARKLNLVENYAENLQVQLAIRDEALETLTRKNAALMDQLERYRMVTNQLEEMKLTNLDLESRGLEVEKNCLVTR